ncbi:Semaphorin-1A-like protein 2 [Sarcoptes scabiei]|uniref:Semaphorin-1A-like protein 2 n=1 Tax=Sarcoptes scabiei TaxID=52283 RepID=A0A132A4Q4_SARSC|nr:Semaphorin-1A-like protein 2 [Sarcoptes scabiei]
MIYLSLLSLGSYRERTEKNLYVATVSGFTGADPLIYREPLRTEQYNPKHLNESAVEFINCGKTIYSRVARVCARDNGGPHKFRKKKNP